MPDLAVARPLRKDDFADEIGLHPMRVAPQPSGRRRRERRRLDLDAIEPGAQVERHLVREAGAHLAGEDQAFTFVVADEQRAETRAHPFGIGEAADDELLPLHAFRLHPAAVPSRAIRLIAPLRDDSFEARAARFLEKRVAAAVDVLGEADAPRLPGADQFLQPRFPFVERERVERLAVQTEQIEDEVDERPALAGIAGVLHRLKARTAIGEDDRRLAVDERIIEPELLHGAGDLRERGGPVVAVARVERHASFADACANAIAVVLNFVEPLVAGRRRRDERRQLGHVVGVRHAAVAARSDARSRARCAAHRRDRPVRRYVPTERSRGSPPPSPFLRRTWAIPAPTGTPGGGGYPPRCREARHSPLHA